MPKVLDDGKAPLRDESVKSRIAQALVDRKPRTEPLWKGPYEDGLTQSMICRFLVCRERFRVAYVEGLEPFPTLSKPLHYGNMWHVCEEYHALNKDWNQPLRKYSEQLQRSFPTQQEAVLLLEMMCRVQFPVYLDYWKNHGPELKRFTLLSEDVFREEYTLPEKKKRTVILRGKFDRVDQDLFGSFWLRENKTKTEIDEFKVERQLKFDLQTMMYLTVLMLKRESKSAPFSKKKLKLGGVQYNVVRRPLSGGKHSIKQHKPCKKHPKGESLDEYINVRLRQILMKEPQDFFGRWDVEVTQNDLTRFQYEFLNPVLTQICDWWDALCAGNPMEPWVYDGLSVNPHHYRTPYGLYNVLLEGGSTDLDEYIETRNRTGLTKIPHLFRELQPESL